MFWGIDLKDWVVEFDDISFINNPKDVREGVGFLKEDMLQICHEKTGRVIDVSWRPSFSIKGGFYAVLVEGGDWDNPSRFLKTRSVHKIKKWIASIVDE